MYRYHYDVTTKDKRGNILTIASFIRNSPADFLNGGMRVLCPVGAEIFNESERGGGIAYRETGTLLNLCDMDTEGRTDVVIETIIRFAGRAESLDIYATH